MLKDLHELGVALQTSYQTTFTQEDKELPVLFKQLVNNIEGSAVNYNRNSFVVTVNYSNQKIYFPNQLWYIAAYFADFYKSLSEYAQIIKSHLRISDENIRKAKDNKEIASSLILHASVSDDDKEYLIRFLYDYNWWYGGKGIERADYYVSPILSLCKLVNASQSYVAELCKFLAKNEEALDVLKQVNDHREQNKIQILEDDVLNSFVYKLLKYIETEYTFDALASYARYTDANRLGFNDTLIHFELEDKKTHSIFIQTSDESNISSRNSGKIKRWYEDIFHFNQKDVYLTTQWGADTVEPLIFIINNAYKGKLEVSKIGDKYILHVFKTGLSTTDHSSYLPYLTALRTKPFMLLAGISGTGKSRIVRKLAQATNTKVYENEADRWNDNRPDNFELIQVKPNWHNSMDVVGFYSNISKKYEFTPFVEFIVKAWQHTDTPYFLCLDEMNLAPVEEYLAEFLSAIESRSVDEKGNYTTDPIIKPFKNFGQEVCEAMLKELLGEARHTEANPLAVQFTEKGLTLPPNLMVMGTVNMDETTFSFSRKVLDRAMSVEMNEVNYDDFMEGKTELMPLLTEQNALLVNRPQKASEVQDRIDGGKVIAYLKAVNALLDGTPFKLGYRAANEAMLYVSACKDLAGEQFSIGKALDEFTLMKILSRIEGDDNRLSIDEKDARIEAAGITGAVTDNGEHSINLLNCLRAIVRQHIGQDTATEQKINSMYNTLVREHFVSYWG